MSGPRPLGMEVAPVPEGFPGRVEFVKSAHVLADCPHQPEPEICFCGRSNVGKSSLLNVLINRKSLARVSSTPGRTRLINFFNVQDRVTFVDLPGYGWAKVSRKMKAAWGETIRNYLEGRPQLCLALLLVDIRRDPGDEERSLLAWFQARELPCVVIATKADKVKPARQGARLRVIAQELSLSPRDVLPFSALTKKGRETVWGVILAQVQRETASEAL